MRGDLGGEPGRPERRNRESRKKRRRFHPREKRPMVKEGAMMELQLHRQWSNERRRAIVSRWEAIGEREEVRPKGRKERERENLAQDAIGREVSSRLMRLGFKSAREKSHTRHWLQRKRQLL